MFRGLRLLDNKFLSEDFVKAPVPNAHLSVFDIHAIVTQPFVRCSGNATLSGDCII